MPIYFVEGDVSMPGEANLVRTQIGIEVNNKRIQSAYVNDCWADILEQGRLTREVDWGETEEDMGRDGLPTDHLKDLFNPFVGKQEVTEVWAAIRPHLRPATWEQVYAQFLGLAYFITFYVETEQLNLRKDRVSPCVQAMGNISWFPYVIYPVRGWYHQPSYSGSGYVIERPKAQYHIIPPGRAQGRLRLSFSSMQGATTDFPESARLERIRDDRPLHIIYGTGPMSD